MGELVNLRHVRKHKLREDRLTAAAEQRVRHGRSQAERSAEATRLAREQARLAGHRIEDPRTPDAGADTAPQDHTAEAGS